MPCRVDDDYDDALNVRTQNHTLKRDLNEVTQLLCAVASTLESSGADLSFVEGLPEWWKAHKAADEARHKREAKKAHAAHLAAVKAAREKQLRKEALSKLTPEERLALRLTE